mgnify:CR=1 FL=1
MAGSVGFVPRFEPFNAIRYASGVNWDEVIAPPYDVLSEDDVRDLAAYVLSGANPASPEFSKP